MLALYTLPMGGASKMKFGMNPLSLGAASAAFIKLGNGVPGSED